MSDAAGGPRRVKFEGWVDAPPGSKPIGLIFRSSTHDSLVRVEHGRGFTVEDPDVFVAIMAGVDESGVPRFSILYNDASDRTSGGCPSVREWREDDFAPDSRHYFLDRKSAAAAAGAHAARYPFRAQHGVVVVELSSLPHVKEWGWFADRRGPE